MDKALKQRLVGASVLVALAVVVLPMLLGGPQETQQETRAIEVPPRPAEVSLETRRFPIGDQDPAKPSSVDTTAIQQLEPEQNETVAVAANETPDDPPPATDSMAEPAGADVDAADNTHGQSAPADALTAEPALLDDAPASAPGRYLVQVASFGSIANANRLAGRLRDAGMPVLTDTIDSAAGTLHRVRVGPFNAAEDANAAVTGIRSQVPDLNPRVMDLRPEEAAQVSEPSDPLVRWVVQVGSFADAENAENLVYRLRDAGFRASSVRVSDDQGVAFKVRVGPEIERQMAVALAQRLREEQALEGLVMSVD